MSTPNKIEKGMRVTAREYQGSPKGTVESNAKVIRGESYYEVRWDDADKLFYGKAILEPASRLKTVRA